jgi:FMN-dependent NADH-azoreductase
MQTKYLQLILGFIGFTNIRSVIVEPTLQGSAEAIEVKVQQAAVGAKKIAENF